MALVVNHNFKDSPAVSAELVKFLSMNTSVEAVDQLTSQMLEFKNQFSDMNRKVTSAGKEAGTVGNKYDKLVSEINELKKRVKKLEDKK